MPTEHEETQAFDPAERPGAPLAAGDVLGGRYRLDRELGRGGMGVVFRATDLELRREVAVKVLPASATSVDARERLLREARAAAALNHPNIVAVHDVGLDRGTPFLVMELVAGRNLGEARITDLRGIVEVASRICDALAHAHAHGLVHRDLKPDNVLVSDSGALRGVKLADLGLAVGIEGSRRITDAGTILGTASYMAPEQALGQPVDGRADLYALGAVLYELCTGRPPFQGGQALEIVSQHVHAPVVPPRVLRPDLPPALDAVIVRLLAKNPTARFADAGAVRQALESALDGAQLGPDAETPAAVALLDALCCGRLVAREAELVELRELWRRAIGGTAHCALISGEPGAGKTRLAREVLLQVALDGGVSLQGACYENEATTPYLPFVEAFRRLVREEQDDVALERTLGEFAPEIAKLAPEVETRLGPAPARPALPPHEERLLFFDAVAQVLRSLASPRGLLFYVDDLHWADSSTLWLLGHLLRNLKDARVLFAASYRDTELDRAHPLAKALDDWNRERLTTRVRLGRFAPPETRAQLGALLGEEVPAEFSDAVHRETEGNPFFVEEVLKALIEQGSVRRESGRWARAEVGEIAIPQSMKAAIGRRLDRVSPECTEVLRTAAVLGKVFDFGELVAAQEGADEDRLLDALDEAVAAQLVAARGGESFVFTHDKIREVLYGELNPIRRRRLHRRVAEGLERLRGAPVERLAHHFIEAGEHERGLEFAKRAGVEAEQLFAYDEAIAAYARALECAEALGLGGQSQQLEEAMGNACLNAGNTIPAAEHFERALRLATDPQARARLHCQAANSLVTTGDPRGLEYARQARAVLDRAYYPFEVAGALAIEGRFHHLACRHREAAALIEQAEKLAAAAAGDGPLSAPHASTLSVIYAYGSGAYQHLGLFEEADRWAWRGIEFGQRHGVLLAQAIGFEFLGENATGTGEYRAGLEYCEREREIVRRLRSRERLAWSGWVAGVCCAQLGEDERAEREFACSIELASAIGERRLLPLLIAHYAAHLASRGRLDEALDAALEGRERAEALGLLYMRTEAQRCLAEVRFARGELDEALGLCDVVLGLTEGLETRVSRLWLGPLHVRALLAAGRRADAAQALERYAALVAQCQSPRFSQDVARLNTELSPA